MTTATPVPDHHPAIRAEDLSPVLQAPEFTVGFLGIKTRVEFEIGMMAGYQPPPESRLVTPGRPGFNEEYFEWVDVLEAVAEAGPEFVMVELGAGYGRWLMRGAAAARRRGGCAFHGVGVEAEPAHFRWMRQHFRDNDVDPERLELIWAAIGVSPGFVPFWVGNADAWYGQAVAHRAPSPPPDARARRRLKARSALGRPPAPAEAGEAVVWVPCVTLEDVISPYARIDLMDLDVQGLELDVLSAGIDLVDQKVRRVHVGTHSAAVEEGLRTLFGERGWSKVNDYPCQSRVQTPYGDIDFGDGVQTWLNPRLAGGATVTERRRSKPRPAPTPAPPPEAGEEDPPDAAPAEAPGAGVEAAAAADPYARLQALKERNRRLREKNDRLRADLEGMREKYRKLRAKLEPGRKDPAGG